MIEVLCYSYSLGGRLQDLQGDTEVYVSVRSYAGVGVVIKVAKKEGMENMELLDNSEEKLGENEGATGGGGLWTTLSK